MQSMTGFGRGESYCDSGISFCVEISTVNKKQLDIRVQLPRELVYYEAIIRSLVSRRLNRGSILIRMNMKIEDKFFQQTVSFNEDLAAFYLRKIEHLQERLDLPAKIEICNIINLPGVIENNVPDYDLPELEQTLTAAVDSALDRVIEMRQQEGASLKESLKKSLATIESIVGEIEPLSEKIPELQKARLLERLRESGLSIDSNDERVLRELVIFTDRSDVTEEITRLRSHFSQFNKFLAEKKYPVGRSLEFLVQEILREINTLGNKAVHGEVSPMVINFKTELEKMREQIQNVE